MADLDALLRCLVDERGSDLHVKAGAVPHVRRDGVLHPTGFPVITAPQAAVLAESLVPASRAAELEANHEVEIALSLPGLGRFRAHLCRQRGSISIVVRRVLSAVPTIESLGLPSAMGELVDRERGLVLVTGPGGSGRSTACAALVDRINSTRRVHIVTLEDPIEALHADKLALVTQREVGADTIGFAEGLRRVLHHDPDVIYVSSLADSATARGVLGAVESGRLVIASLEAPTAAVALDRLVDLVAPSDPRLLRATLATNLRGVVNLRLLERVDGNGRVPAVEILTVTPVVFDLLVEGQPQGRLGEILDEMASPSMDGSLLNLYEEEAISLRDAMAVATRPDRLRRALQPVA